MKNLVEVAARAANPPANEDCQRTESGNECSLVYHGERITTVAELLKSADIDLALWEVIEQTVNNWEVAGKHKRGNGLWKTGLRQIKVKLRRLAPKPIQDALKELLKDVRPIATGKPPKPPKVGRHLVEIGIFDHHFGKLCWGLETGQNYDLRIAEREFCTAVDEMLSRVSGFNVERIVFPLGNDFFHVNDWHSQTANLTKVDSVDDRFSKVFRVGLRAMQYCIERCIEIAPISVLWVPGNHDRHTSWYLTETLAALFRGNRYVTFDNGPNERKYLAYGPSLLGYTHGDESKHNDLPGLMATEAPQMWANARFKSWRLGHWHKRKEVRHTAGDTFNGVEVKIFPSLCGTDGWHYRKGFCGNARMAEVHLWSETDGPVGNFVVHAKEKNVALAV